MLLHDILKKVSKISTALSFMAAITVAGCGGGGGGSGGGNTSGGTTTGTAVQYFTKNAVGNTFTFASTSTTTVTGQAPSTTIGTQVSTITAFTGGIETDSSVSTTNGITSQPSTNTRKIDASGALVSISGTSTYVILPATFSVGTTWIALPADSATGQSAYTASISAFNVTRTIPAGTFTDCLQIDRVRTITSGGVITTYIDTGYFSPTVGRIIEWTLLSSSSSGGVVTASSYGALKLQAGYVANNAIPTSITATANTTTQNLTIGLTISSFSPLAVSGGTAPYIYSYTGALPAGLSLNASTGAITGTPTAAYTTANVVFSVKDANNVTASTTSTVSFSVTAGVVGTAAQYFTKKAVGNTWTWQGSDTTTSTGQAPFISTRTNVTTITASAGGVVTYSSTSNGATYPGSILTMKIDTTGALVSTDGTHTWVELPANFSVGSSWVAAPADPAMGQSAEIAKIIAFNVTRIVPAGTFTDCLQMDRTWTTTSGGVTTAYSATVYFSPTAGDVVDGVRGFTDSSGGVVTATSSGTWQLQPGYIANP